MAEGPRSNRPTPRTPAAAEAELRRRIRMELEQARKDADGQLDDGQLAAIIARAVASALQWHLEAPEHTRDATLSSRTWRPAAGPRGPRSREEREFDRPPRDRDFDRPPRDADRRERDYDRDRRERDYDRRERDYERPEREYERPDRDRDFDRPRRDFDRPRRQGGRPPSGYRGGGFKSRGQRRPPRPR